jgi:hypothetical protein
LVFEFDIESPEERLSVTAKAMGKKIALAAPTRRAAQRQNQVGKRYTRLLERLSNRYQTDRRM